MNRLKLIVAAVAMVLAGGTSNVLAEIPGNPKTPSGYQAVLDEDTNKWSLCWSDTHGHGNCMDVGEVFELIRNTQTEYEAWLLENSI